MNLIHRYLMLYVCIYIYGVYWISKLYACTLATFIYGRLMLISISFFLIVLNKDLVCIQQHFRLTNSHLQLEKINI